MQRSLAQILRAGSALRTGLLKILVAACVRLSRGNGPTAPSVASITPHILKQLGHYGLKKAGDRGMPSAFAGALLAFGARVVVLALMLSGIVNWLELTIEGNIWRGLIINDV